MLTVNNAQRTLVVDYCKYDSRADPTILKNNGIALPIIKCSSGNQEDPKFRTHAEKALSLYNKIGVYHWIDPTISYIANGRFLVDLLLATKYPIAFVMLDYEQWWASWSLWFQAIQNNIPWTSVPVVGNIALSTHAQGLYSMAVANGFRTNVYTGAGFLSTYTPSSKIWLAHTDVVWAGYPKQPAVRTVMTWPQLVPYYPTAIPSSVVGNVVGHQFTGDRCQMPGVYAISGGKEIQSPLDISMFDIAYLQSCGVPVTPISGSVSTVPPTVPSLSIAVVNVVAVNVRSGPGTTYPIVGLKKLSDLVATYETSNGYTRTGVNTWIYTLYLTPR